MTIIAKQIAQIEFSAFKNAVELRKDRFCEQPKIDQLKRRYGLYTDLTRERAVQINFGGIPIDHLQDEGEFILEDGGCLVYSMGTDGRVVTILYPAKSNFSKPFEDNIILRHGFFSSLILQRCLTKDLRDLATYTIGTSTFGEPSLREKIRVFWLRRSYPLTIDGKYRNPKLFGYVAKASDFGFRAMIMALMKPLGILVIVGVLIFLGQDSFIQFITNSGTND
jgi:hypothetical protein